MTPAERYAYRWARRTACGPSHLPHHNTALIVLLNSCMNTCLETLRHSSPLVVIPAAADKGQQQAFHGVLSTPLLQYCQCTPVLTLPLSTSSDAPSLVHHRQLHHPLTQGACAQCAMVQHPFPARTLLPLTSSQYTPPATEDRKPLPKHLLRKAPAGAYLRPPLRALAWGSLRTRMLCGVTSTCRAAAHMRVSVRQVAVQALHLRVSTHGADCAQLAHRCAGLLCCHPLSLTLPHLAALTLHLPPFLSSTNTMLQVGAQ